MKNANETQTTKLRDHLKILYQQFLYLFRCHSVFLHNCRCRRFEILSRPQVFVHSLNAEFAEFVSSLTLQSVKRNRRKLDLEVFRHEI